MLAVLENPAVRSLAQPLSVKGYHLLRDWGAIAIKTELIHGVVIKKMSKSPLHSYIANLLFARLENALPAGYWLRKEDPLTLADSEPEPDISVVKGCPQDFRSEHPHHAELVVEVAISSLSMDREKAAMYATAGIPFYWLVDVAAQQVEVYSLPQGGTYQDKQIRRETLVAPFGVTLQVGDLFGGGNPNGN